MKVQYIPLGTRCSSAFVIRDNLKKRDFSLPFDWLDMPFTAISNFLSIKIKDIPKFVDEYFESMISVNAHRHVDGTWFPHDIEMKDERYWVLKSDTKEKFGRRLKRLLKLLKTKSYFVFLTTVIESGKYDEKDFQIVKEQIEKMVGKNNCLFITINLGPDKEEENHFNFLIKADPEDDGYKIWENDIAIKVNELIRKIQT